jgi:hypothetical protein
MRWPFSRGTPDPDFLDLEGAIPAPHIFIVNRFLEGFLAAAEVRIQFDEEEINRGNGANPLVETLRESKYENIRLRLRVMSSLNPVVNREREEGTINGTMRGREFKLRTIFAPKGESITIEKIVA